MILSFPKMNSIHSVVCSPDYVPGILPSTAGTMGFPGGASAKEPACQRRRCRRHTGSIPGLGRSPGEGHGTPLQYSSLENHMDRRAWWATVHTVAQSWTWLKWLSMHAWSWIFFLPWRNLHPSKSVVSSRAWTSTECCRNSKEAIEPNLRDHRSSRKEIKLDGRGAAWLQKWI